MSTSEAADKALVYLECDGQLQHDTKRGETVCRECGLLVNEKLTQGEVSEVTNVSEITIRNLYQELLENEGAQQQAPRAD